MRNIVLSISLTFVMKANAKKLMNPIGNTLDSMHKLVGNVIGRIQEPLLPHQADLNSTTLGAPFSGIIKPTYNTPR